MWRGEGDRRGERERTSGLSRSVGGFFLYTYFVSCNTPCAQKGKRQRKKYIVIIIIIVIIIKFPSIAASDYLFPLNVSKLLVYFGWFLRRRVSL